VRRTLANAWLWLGLQAGWMYAAAFSLVGIEVFEMLVGITALAPELFPFIILALAMIFYFRRGIARALVRSRRRFRRPLG
jgi:hypothetical protein